MPGITEKMQRRTLDVIKELNQQRLETIGDPEIATRIAQYEMAFRMQSSVPELVDFSSETQATLARYGPDVLNICSGGFLFDAEFTPQRLSELAKDSPNGHLALAQAYAAEAFVHVLPFGELPPLPSASGRVAQLASATASPTARIDQASGDRNRALSSRAAMAMGSP